MSHQLKEWRMMRFNPSHKLELMLDRAEDMRHTNRLHDAMIYLTRIWNAVDGGFFPLSGHDEDTCNRGEVDGDLVDDLWHSMLYRCPWAFLDQHNVNSMNFTYR